MASLRLPGMLLLLGSLMFIAGCERSTETQPAEKPALEKPSVPLVGLPNFTALAKKEGPAVVNISISKQASADIPFHGIPRLDPDDPFYQFFKRFGFGDSPHVFRTQSLGSGFIIDQDGYILTNSHVVEGADEVSVVLLDKREFKAQVIGSDKRSDVALLKISAKNLPFVTIGDPTKLEVGEWVVAIGTPFGFSNSVTQGIVSAKGRALPGQNLSPFIQTDVAVNPGNSGGPLFNLNGEVVGINAQIYSQSGGYMGISFAIPIDVAIKVKNELLKHGKVRRGKLGVSIQDVSPELAAAFGLPKVAGALISSLENGGPAEQAGLAPGDVVLQFSGKTIENSAELARTIGETAPGASVPLRVWRDGSSREIVVTLGEVDAVSPALKSTQKATLDRLGLGLRELSGAERRLLGTESAVVVDAVGGKAASAGIRPGDMILSINNTPVTSLEKVRSELEKSSRHVALLVQRGTSTRIFFSLSLKE